MIGLEIPTPNIFQCGSQIKTVKEKESQGEIEMSQTTTPNVFKFVELFSFLTDKESSAIAEDELELVCFSLNLTYGNLRINAYSRVKNLIHNNTMFLGKNTLTTYATVYPTSVYYIRNLRNGCKYYPVDQLYSTYDPVNNPWQNELPYTEFYKYNDRIKLTIVGKKTYFYIFSEQQVKLFNHMCDYVLNQSFNAVASNIANL